MQSHKTLKVRLLSSPDEAARLLSDQAHVLGVESSSDTVQVEFEGDPESQAELLRGLILAGHKVIGFREEEADLEDVFLKLTTGAVH